MSQIATNEVSFYARSDIYSYTYFARRERKKAVNLHNNFQQKTSVSITSYSQANLESKLDKAIPKACKAHIG